jgi:serine phosphatase RsbU (regulator of sigma subunit)
MQAIKKLKKLFRISQDLSQYTWREARNKYGGDVMLFVLVTQSILVPFHILTTDYLDESTRFSIMSLAFRFGAVFLFILTYLFVKKFEVHSDFYYGITFFINAMSDAYVSVYSSEENIITHMLGYGLVMIAYCILIIPPKLYGSIMVFSTAFLFVLHYLVGTLDFRVVLENGGAFVLFFVVICPLLNMFRYGIFKNDFYSLRKMNELNNELLQQQEELQQQQEEILTQKEALATVNEQLDKKNRDLTASITYASRLQRGILPATENLKKYFPDSFILFQPRDIVSGDFYWFAEKDDRCMLVAADCTGHGVPGALMSMIAHSSLNKAFFEYQAHSPDLLLKITSDEIVRNLDQNTNRTSDGMDAIACAYLPKENNLLFAAAKNSIFYVKNNEMQEIRGDNCSVGGYVYGENRDFTLHCLSIDEPVTIYLSSDGYYDQFGGERGKKIGRRKFQEILLEIHQRPMEEQKKYLQLFFQKWVNEASERQLDDVMVIGLRVEPNQH